MCSRLLTSSCQWSLYEYLLQLYIVREKNVLHIKEDKTGQELRTSLFVVSCSISVHFIFSLSRWKSGRSEVEAL